MNTAVYGRLERANDHAESAMSWLADANSLHDELGDLLGALRRRIDTASCSVDLAGLRRLSASARLAAQALQDARDEMEAVV